MLLREVIRIFPYEFEAFLEILQCGRNGNCVYSVLDDGEKGVERRIFQLVYDGVYRRSLKV